MNRLLLTVEESARRIGLGRSKLYELVLTGELESIKIGKARRIPVVALEAYVERLREQARQETDASQPELDAAAAPRT